MSLPSRPKRCSRPRRLLWGLFSSLAALSTLSFLLSGGHEVLLSHSLPYVLPGGGHPIGTPLLPSADAFLLLPRPEACTPRAPSLLVLVASAPGHDTRRQAIRATWGGTHWAGELTVRTFFALGVPSEPQLQAALEGEAAEHGDLIQGRFLDTYANLTLKTLALLGWAVTHCPGALFLAKVDDDVFLNLPTLAEELGRRATLEPAYLGRIHWHVWPNRDPRNRHHVPATLYPGGSFPPYCSGSAYILSGAAVPALLGTARQVPLVPLEDVFVGLCAHRAGIVPQHLTHMAGATHLPVDPCCYRRVLFSVHGVSPQDMVAAWDAAAPHEEVCSLWQRALGILRCKALTWMAAL
ncbi:beta-1,3-galactosyltransferase 4 [Sceloporus undulatus]|uniref:beta-1,3-galactosyltransferase 4 n=1 Tax=Sceloporus undulatus TaxID=8520 RepID=UPI001C4D2689|nr:beta-1,3-galactosyltransferase 4 [Sceloporus undulatus]